MALVFWRNSSPWFRRIFSVVIFFVLAIIVTTAGVLTNLSPEEAQSLNNELEQTQKSVETEDIWSSTWLIFSNNFKIDLIMFIPFAGIFLGFFVLYSTGLVIAAVSQVVKLPPLLAFFSLFFYPFSWMEFIAYSVALAESVWLTWRLIHHKGKREIIRTLELILICGAILLAAAFIEAAMIQAITRG